MKIPGREIRGLELHTHGLGSLRKEPSYQRRWSRGWWPCMGMVMQTPSRPKRRVELKDSWGPADSYDAWLRIQWLIIVGLTAQWNNSPSYSHRPLKLEGILVLPGQRYPCEKNWTSEVDAVGLSKGPTCPSRTCPPPLGGRPLPASIIISQVAPKTYKRIPGTCCLFRNHSAWGSPRVSLPQGEISN